jgi:predicted AlkP superfamily phosphohydrolase/phosphomutase
LPLSGGKVVLLRQGAAFWEELNARDIETTIVRMPANFPPAGTATRELSGMGTPDILGTYGTFTFFTADAAASSETDVSGGHIVAVRPLNGAFRGVLRGPDNPFRMPPEALSVEVSVFTDPVQRSAKLVLGSIETILLEGEWSDWLPIEFSLAPMRTLPAMCRFYLKQVNPTPQLYVTPLNIDPLQPALPISSPPGWAAELARATGRFYTQGMPEDTKAYSSGVFDAHEFLAQARLTEEENLEQYRSMLATFDQGLLFFYFGCVDQVSHMMWRSMDPGHPAYDAATDAPFAEVIPELYERMDAIVGYTLAQMDSATTLFVMSDHGFASWRRSFSLNAWLREHGYLALRDSATAEDVPMLANIDWQRTRAYGLGLNGLYVNLRGREKSGIVPPEEQQALLQEIAAKLQESIDPATGKPAVTRVYRRDDVFVSRGSLDIGPDLLVGYAKGTRCSEGSAIGAVPVQVFADNRSAWSGDHCMDHTTVPGILLTNRLLQQPVHKLSELGAAIVSAFGDSRNARTTGDNANEGTR